MSDSMDRRQALKMISGVGLAAVLGGSGCFRPAPTRPAQLWTGPAGRAFALVNATVIDVEKGQALTDHSVLIEDGLIQGVFAADSPELAQARPVDCGGAYLIPGLINAHCHINSPAILNPGLGDMGLARDQMIRNYEGAICWGVTTIRDMGAMPKIIARDREAIDRGDMLGPRIRTAMAFITVPDGYPDFMKEVHWLTEALVGKPSLRARNVAEAKDAVKYVVDCGADLIKIGLDHRSITYGRTGRLPVLSDAQLEAIRQEADKHNLPVAAHHLYSQGLDRGLQFRVDTLEHVIMDRPHTDAQLQALLDTKTPSVPTLTVGISMAFKSKGDPFNDDPELNEALQWREDNQFAELAKHCIPELVEKSAEIRRFYENEQYALPKNKNVLAFDPRAATGGVVMAANNLRRLIAEGAVLGAGNDSGVPFIFPGMIHLEMELLGRLGMSNAQVLAAATIVNAGICGLQDRCGTVEAGKWADLVLLAGNPLDDLKNAGKVKAVFKQGALVSKAEDFQLSLDV